MKIEETDLPKNQEFCAELEERVSNWIKGISKVLLESEQLRRENDSSGPQDELEYWKCRGAQFSQLMSFLGEREVQYTLQVLTISGSKVLKQWKETDRKITFCYNEAKDNSKFIQSIEQCCHSLYLDDPVMRRGCWISCYLFYNVSGELSSSRYA